MSKLNDFILYFSVNLPYYCGFEDAGICEMTYANSGRFNWTRNSGQTPTLNTGPETAHGQQYYMFIETSTPQSQGDFAM